MSFEEWFKNNTNESVNEHTHYSRQFVNDAYEAGKQEGNKYRRMLSQLVYVVRLKKNELATERILVEAEQLLKE